MTGWRRGVLWGLVLALLLGSGGCVSWGRASFKAYDWGGSVFAPNPVAWIPWWVGFGLFAVVGLPLDLVSWPLTALFFPDEKDEPSREFYFFSAVGPSVFLGVGGGTLLGGLFYPFGLPFMGERKGWSDEAPRSDEEPLPPPPGGDRPPVRDAGGPPPTAPGEVAPPGSGTPGGR